jgi:arginyl-tRNA--protein-N-Asp/Glu arginylyltransferase
MTHLRDLPPFPLLQFYATAPYGCSYLPGRIARSQVATPTHLIDSATYSELVRAGFRRSGVFTYRPYCDACRECQPVRLNVAAFVPNRSQRRALAQHAELTARECSLSFREEHYQLYQHYQAARHSGGGMDQDSRDQYAHFLLQTHVDSRLIEFREGGSCASSASSTCWPTGSRRSTPSTIRTCPNASYGTFAILWQIAQCQHMGLPWLYLGYWIRDSRKMAYKARFRPLQALRHGEWQAVEA